MEREWNSVHFVDDFFLEGEKLPRDGQWAYWKDSFGNVEIARMKFDIQDHFWPRPETIREENIVAWAELDPQN